MNWPGLQLSRAQPFILAFENERTPAHVHISFTNIKNTAKSNREGAIYTHYSIAVIALRAIKKYSEICIHIPKTPC